MTIDVQKEFEKHDDSFLDFDSVESKRSNCQEVHAFMLLNELVPSSRMIAGAEHDQIWLAPDIEKLSEVATSEHIRELCACGVFFDADIECLSMFR